MEIIKNFGIDPYLVGAEIVNFLIILYVLKRFLYKPVFSMLKKREEMIKQGLKDAKTSKEELEKTEVERKKILKLAREDAKKIIDEANRESQEIIASAAEKAKKQTSVSLKEAQEEIVRETREAEKRLQSKIGLLVENIIKQSLKDLLSPAEQKEILEKTLKYLPKHQYEK